MKWLQELIVHLPTFSSSDSQPGEPGHSPEAAYPAPSLLFRDPRAGKRQDVPHVRKTTLLLLHPNLWR